MTSQASAAPASTINSNTMAAPAPRGTPPRFSRRMSGDSTEARIAAVTTGITIVCVSDRSHTMPTSRSVIPTSSHAMTPSSRSQVGAAKMPGKLARVDLDGTNSPRARRCASALSFRITPCSVSLPFRCPIPSVALRDHVIPAAGPPHSDRMMRRVPAPPTIRQWPRTRNGPRPAPGWCSRAILVAGVANLNLSVANVALPDIGKHFDSSQTMLDLIAVGTRSAWRPPCSTSVRWRPLRAQDDAAAGPRALGTRVLLAAFAPSDVVLFGARVLGGVSAGMAYPTTLALITALWSGPGAPRRSRCGLRSAARSRRSAPSSPARCSRVRLGRCSSSRCRSCWSPSRWPRTTCPPT